MVQNGGEEAQEKESTSGFRPSDKKRAEKQLRKLGLIEGAIGFRDDLEEMFSETVKREYSDSEKRQLLNAGQKGARDAGKAYKRIGRGVRIVNTIEVVCVLGMWILAFFAISIPNFGLTKLNQVGLSGVITVATYLIGSNVVLGEVTTEKLAYQNLTVRLPDEILNFRSKWNKAVLVSAYSFIGVIIVGLIR